MNDKDPHKIMIQSMVKDFKSLNETQDTDLNDLIYANKEDYQELYMAMATFISKTCGNLNKIHEKRTQLALLNKYENDKRGGGEGGDDTIIKVEHVHNTYGADIILERKNGDRIKVELKSSTVKMKNKFKTNWMFNISLVGIFSNKDKNLPLIRKTLLAYLKTNIYSGEVILQAMHDGVEIFTCTLSGLFMSILFTKMITDEFSLMGSSVKSMKRKKEKVINLGTTYCVNHKTYHRIEKLESYDKKMKERKSNFNDTNVFDEVEWLHILGKCGQTNCNK